MSSGSHSACDHTAPSCHSQASQEACCLASHLVGGVEDLQNRAQLPLGPSGLGAEDEASECPQNPVYEGLHPGGLV